MQFLVKALTAAALAFPLYIVEPRADPGALAQTPASLTAAAQSIPSCLQTCSDCIVLKAKPTTALKRIR